MAVSCDTGNTTPATLAGMVSIDGTVAVGETLTANTTGLTNASGAATYQWKRDDTNIGANQATYSIDVSDIGGVITVVVTYSGNTGSVTSTPTIVVPTNIQELAGNVAINGTVEVGETLTANITGLTNLSGTPIYQWKRGETVIGLNQNTYQIVSADIGGAIKVMVSSSGNTGSITSTATAAVPQNYETVLISDDSFYSICADLKKIPGMDLSAVSAKLKGAFESYIDAGGMPRYNTYIANPMKIIIENTGTNPSYVGGIIRFPLTWLSNNNLTAINNYINSLGLAYMPSQQKSIFLANVNHEPQQMAAVIRNELMDKLLAKNKVARQPGNAEVPGTIGVYFAFL
jgi:hypothetical protein